MHVPLRALHHIHLQILFFHGKVSHQWQINIFANTHKVFFCIPALTLQADVLKASSGLFGFFCLNGAMQSNAASPNRLPEYICSSRNSFLQALNSLITRSLLTLCSDHQIAKAAFTRNNMHCLDSEPTPAFENLLQHSANALYFLIISTCLGNCSQLSTHQQYFEPHFSGFDILNLTPRPQKAAETCWQLIITFQRKRNITLYCKQKIHCSFKNYGEYTDAPANTTCFFIN